MRRPFLIIIPLVFLFFLLASCVHHKPYLPEVSSSQLPKVSVKIHRYGQALFRVDTSNFRKGIIALKGEFPYFLDANLNDTANLNKLYSYVTDTQLLHVSRYTQERFPDLQKEAKQLSGAFSHLKYYFPHYKLPWVYTYISGLYYEQPVVKKDTVLIIALDDYLGKNYLSYEELRIPQYHRRCMNRNHIAVDVMKTLYLHDFYHAIRTKTLLDKMVEAGKQLYFLDAMMPQLADSLKICYTSKQMEWMKVHKRDVWAVLVKNRLLFSTNYLMVNKMTQPGPFTDGFSRQSPAGMANWFGWQMVRTYMSKHPATSLKDLLKIKDAQGLLEASAYKP